MVLKGKILLDLSTSLNTMWNLSNLLSTTSTAVCPKRLCYKVIMAGFDDRLVTTCILVNFTHVQSISVTGPAFLAGEIGPYNQIGPVGRTLVERESKYPIS